MEARHFRILFRNMNDGIYHMLSLWNEYQESKTSMVYLCGSDKSVPHTIGEDSRFAKEIYDVDMLVISYLNLCYLNYVIEMLDQRRVKKIVMPYIDPQGREQLVKHLEEQQVPGKMMFSSKGRTFLKDPYQYALSVGIEDFRYLKGNGPAYEGQDNIPGDYFKPVDLETEAEIIKAEGRFLPVYQAGYMISNQWVFSFGVYEGNKFPTIVMYHGSLEDDTESEDCVITAKPFSLLQACKGEMCRESDVCSLKCTHRSDYDFLRRHNKKELHEYENGTLLLGNMIIPGHVEELYKRFQYVKEKVRCISVPNCGAKENWDYRVMGFGKENNYRYFVGAANQHSDSETFRWLDTISPYIRYSMTNEYYGFCCSGHLVKRIR